MNPGELLRCGSNGSVLSSGSAISVPAGVDSDVTVFPDKAAGFVETEQLDRPVADFSVSHGLGPPNAIAGTATDLAGG
jgi:hypothetical protein